MNVTDVDKHHLEPNVDSLAAIFERQRELAAKYHDIERRAGTGIGLLGDRPFNIHELRSQEVCKNFAWRVTEEITEATLALAEHDDSADNDNAVPIHAWEEAADALHFLIELYIHVGITPEEIRRRCNVPSPAPEGSTFEWLWGSVPVLTDEDAHGSSVWESAYELIETLGAAMNCLKQKPWKQTHVLTDVERFTDLLASAIPAYIEFAMAIGMTRDDVVDMYFRKSVVNSFRIRSKY